MRWNVKQMRSVTGYAFVPAVMEHIELAVHSGDSACILPSVHISRRKPETIKEYKKDQKNACQRTNECNVVR